MLLLASPVNKKRALIRDRKPRREIGLLVGNVAWAFLAFLVKNLVKKVVPQTSASSLRLKSHSRLCSTLLIEPVEYDPWAVLRVDRITATSV